MLHLYIQLCSTCLTPATWAGPSSKSPSTFSFTTPFSSGTSLRFIPIPVMSYLAILGRRKKSSVGIAQASQHPFNHIVSLRSRLYRRAQNIFLLPLPRIQRPPVATSSVEEAVIDDLPSFLHDSSVAHHERRALDGYLLSFSLIFAAILGGRSSGRRLYGGRRWEGERERRGE
uniref:Carboxyl-terminal-processing peptidase 1ic isoform X1 n=1 Tax=Rhizophora mucronata TaxID=61149 RepID=A0A2P2LXQ6_RHIMU